MTRSTLAVVAFFLIASLLASAAPAFTYPSHINGLPRDASHLALDEETREVIAFSRRGETLGRFALSNLDPDETLSRRDSGQCSSMSSSDVQNLPGWNTLKSTAEKNWGTGSYNVVTNDKDYPSQLAQNCVSTDVVQIVPDGEQVGTSGTISLTHSQGTVATTTSTVSQQSSLDVGVSVSASVSFPGVVNVTAGFSFSATFTNTLSTAIQSKSDDTQSITKTQTNSAGKTCNLQFTTQSCTITGSGKVRVLGTGWVWFEYNSATQGHYKWALSIDSTLTNQDDRSSFLEFKTTTGTTTTSGFNGVCK
ncbi:hypothetical protein C8R44DRAFT_919578 [Mycena epipterygia]|nr:hypothetical protein C8R44DRAFT_919578 [Mycena epipterygia]